MPDFRLRKLKRPDPAKQPDMDRYDLSWQDWHGRQTPENMGRLLSAVDPVLTAAMKSYVGGPSPTLHSRARIMAAEAARKFDPKRGVKFRTYLMTELKGLSRYSVQHQPISTPERVVQDWHRIGRLASDFSRKYRREPSTSELADLSGLSESRISHVRRTYRRVLHEGGVSSPEGEPLDIPVYRASKSDIAKEMVYHDLDDEDKIIFDYRLGAHGQARTGVEDIARKLHISPASVSERAKKISTRLVEAEELA